MSAPQTAPQTSPMELAGTFVGMLTSDPHNETVQQLVWEFAHLVGTESPVTRTHLLSRLAGHRHTCERLRRDLGAHPEPEVRQVAWTHPAWGSDEVVAMVAAERDQKVRLRALWHADLPPAAYEAVALPLTQDRATVVLQRARHLPDGLVLSAFTHLLEQLYPPGASQVTQRAEPQNGQMGGQMDGRQFAAVARVLHDAARLPQVGGHVLASDGPPLWLQMAAAYTAPESAVAAWATRTAEAGVVVTTNQSFSSDLWAIGTLAQDVATRRNLSQRTRTALRTMCAPFAQSSNPRARSVVRAFEGDGEDLLTLWRSALEGVTSSGDLSRAWDAVPAAVRGTELAEVALGRPTCHKRLFDRIVPFVDGYSEAWLARFVERLDSAPLWLGHFPDLALVRLRDVELSQVVDTIATLGAGTDVRALQRHVFTDALDNAHLWPDGALAYLAADSRFTEPSPDVIDRLPPAVLLLGAKRGGASAWPYARAVLIAQLGRLLDRAPGARTAALLAAASQLEVAAVPMASVIDAIELAADVPDALPDVLPDD